MNYYLKNIFLVIFALQGLIVSSQVINAGVGGNNTAQLLERVEKDVLSEQPDLVIMMVGTNDMINRNKMLSYAEYEHNYRALVKQFKSDGVELLVMSSIPVDSAYVFKRHPRTLFPTDEPNQKMCKAHDMVAQIAQDNSLYYIDLFSAFTALGLPQHNKDVFIRNPKNCGVEDGVHPTPLGYHLIATYVFQYLKERQLIAPNMKIVCFGDSITQGQGAKGKGGVTGETYPAVLSSMLKTYYSKIN